jgi:hypothetical protein
MAGVRERFAHGANAHLSDDETVAKMGHPISRPVRMLVDAALKGAAEVVGGLLG